jgi:hypothetical protein
MRWRLIIGPQIKIPRVSFRQFLNFNEFDVLQGSGKTSKKEADEKACQQYEKFAEQRRKLKEAEGEKSNIEALCTLAQKKR